MVDHTRTITAETLDNHSPSGPQGVHVDIPIHNFVARDYDHWARPQLFSNYLAAFAFLSSTVAFRTSAPCPPWVGTARQLQDFENYFYGVEDPMTIIIHMWISMPTCFTLP